VVRRKDGSSYYKRGKCDDSDNKMTVNAALADPKLLAAHQRPPQWGRGGMGGILKISRGAARQRKQRDSN
jgi:hypothetical protein